MRKVMKWAVRALVLAAVLLAGLAIWKREEVTRLLAVNSLFSEDKIVRNFSHMDRAFLVKHMGRGDGDISPLPPGPVLTLPADVERWITDRSVTALVVLKDGKTVFEQYYLGTEPEDLRISWSVAKSYLSALFGILLAEGRIDSLQDPVTKYAPTLASSAYGSARIIDVLQMSSGVTFNEDYLDFYSDINRMGRTLALGGSMDDFAAALRDTDAAPGDHWQYVSIDTHVIGMVIRGATGRTIPDLLEEKILRPMGLEAAPYYITDGFGTAFVLGGLNLRTRDYARFGQMYLQDGQWNGQQIVPADWVRASTIASAKTPPGDTRYGYQWWIPADGENEYFARGIYGQYIYINRATGVVIATNGADRLFREDGAFDQNLAAFRRISDTAANR